MEDYEKIFEEALNQFETQNFREAILNLVMLYEKGYRKTQILEILNEACYEPNVEEMRANFQENVELLENYPFVLGEITRKFEELPYQLYMISETEFYIFNKKKECFTEIYQFDDGSQFDLHSKEIDSVLFLENEANYSRLRFLNDNLRRSEDLGYDNHIYLFYNSFDDLVKLLLVAPLNQLLVEQKFLFLLGEKNRVCPICFERRFGIDYTKHAPQRLRVEEIKRIIFGWKIENFSGTSFLADIMDFHPDLITIPDCKAYSFYDFYTNQLKGKTASEVVFYLNALPDTDNEKSFISSLVYCQSETISKELSDEFNRISSKEFLNELALMLNGIEYPSAKEWLVGIYLAYSNCHGRKFGRVVPALFVYPHDDMFYLARIRRENIELYFSIIQSFPYHKIIALIRDPVTQAGSLINFAINGHPLAKNEQGEIQSDLFRSFAFSAILPKDYYFPINHPLYQDIAVIRFEDLKLNPEATFESMAEFLNIPVTESMYHTTWCGLERSGVTTENAVFDGFDPAPVYKKYDKYLSLFDKYRIEILSRNCMQAYGYQHKYYDGQPFSDKDLISIMELPFLCESIPTVISPQERQQSRADGMNFIRFALAIKGVPFAVNGGTEQYVMLTWLKPKEDKLKEPLYTTRE